MKFLLLLPAVYLAAVLDTTLVDAMCIGEVTPDLLALTAIVWLLIAAGPRAFLVAGAIALVGDLLAPGRLGVGAFWMLLLGYGITRIKTRVNLDHLARQVPTVWIVLTLWAIAVGLTGRLTGDVALSTTTVLTRAAGGALYTAAVSIPVLMVLGWIREPILTRQRRLAEL